MNEAFDPPKVKHIPLHPAREGTPGEVIYLNLWREFATTRPLEWHAIFVTNGRPVRQRAASVAASFMVFMGCSVGYSFTLSAERIASESSFMGRESAFLAAWAVANRRTHHKNNGLRTVEYMLAREYPIRDQSWRQVDWSLVPAITQEDYDIIESMVAWWSTTQARVMRDIAERLIEVETLRQSKELMLSATPSHRIGAAA